ncbi:peptidase M23 [Bacteroidia bacterium]|nr:peptidase M23 [Bacteroidia bacterium]
MNTVRKKSVLIRVIRVLFAVFLFSQGCYAQEVASPLDIPLFLSGNFGELRSGHFHSGIDFKTQGVTGLPVKSVKEGYISRISVSPYGYGRAVYIDHPDGTTSVYGHLDHFAAKVESAVRDSQYLKESFSVNLSFSPADFPLKKGELFAYSGNTGGSGGPHVHFEFRDTQSERAVDPLPYFKNRIKDTRPPDIRGLMIFPQPGKGIANGSTENQTINLLSNKAGKQTFAKPVTAWGNVGLGIKAYDKMNETSNIYGVNEVILIVDKIEIFHSVMDGFSFNDTRYINSFSESYYMKSFIEPGNKLDIYNDRFSGIIPVVEEKTYHCEYILKDVYGNTSTLEFDILGKEQAIPELNTADLLFSYKKDNAYKALGIDLNIPANNLYTNIYLRIDTISNYTAFAPLYSIGEKIPLHGYCPLTLEITNDSHPDKSKYGIVAVRGQRFSWIGGKYENHKMNIRIRELGQFSITIDTVPPVIQPQNQAKWTATQTISFKISDNLSGVESFKGSLNGQFVLFEYDAKTNSLFCKYDPKRMKKGNQTLHLVVTDSAGNQSKFKSDISF